MDLRQIKELMAAMERTGTKRLKIKQENYELDLERHEEKISAEMSAFPEYLKGGEPREDRLFTKQDAPFFKNPAASSASNMRSPPLSSEVEPAHEGAKAKKGEIIKSPMVGTFYLSPSPDDPPFVRIGDLLQPDSVVCIIEAMKVMNEIKSGIKGRIIEILVENGQPVEFGTQLFRIEN